MPNEVLRKVGDDIMFANSDISPSANNALSASYTRYQLTIHGLTNAASRQSAKADLGAKRAPAYSVMACIEFNTAPTAGAYIEFYWAPSRNATAAVGNAGGASGSDAAFTGVAGGTDDGGVKKCQFIGVLACEAVGSIVQIAHIGVFSPAERYGSLIIKNECGQTLFSTDGAECQIVFSPIIDEVQ